MPFRAQIFYPTTAILLAAILVGPLVGGYFVQWFDVQALKASVAAVCLVLVLSFPFIPVLRRMEQFQRHSTA